jgi:chromosome segregation ATPase
MRDEILKFLTDNLSSLSYLCIPLGLLYQAYRRIVGDNRADRREGQKDTFVNQLSERLQEMQQRGDEALQDKSQLTALNNSLTNERTELRRTLAAQEDTIAALKKQAELLQTSHQDLKERYDVLITPIHKPRSH